MKEAAGEGVAMIAAAGKGPYTKLIRQNLVIFTELLTVYWLKNILYLTLIGLTELGQGPGLLLPFFLKKGRDSI